MAVRQTYQMNAPSGNGGGLILGEPLDVKGRRLAGGLPWMMDLDVTNRVRLGDTLGGGRSGIATPVVPYGGLGLAQRNVGNGAQAVTIDDCVIHCNTAGANTTLNLFSAVLQPDAILYLHKNYDGFAVIVEPSGAETISGEGNNSFTGFREWMVIQSDGANWNIIQFPPRMFDVIRQFAPPNATNTGAISTLQTSASLFFWGRPVLFSLSASMRNAEGANNFHLASFSLQIDAGGSTVIADWPCNIAENHQCTSGGLILTPTQGLHTISLRWQRITGAGTSTIDTNDFYVVTALQF